MKKIFLTSIAKNVLDKFVGLLDKKPKDYHVAFIANGADVYAKKDRFYINESRNKLLELGFNIYEIDIRNKNKEQLEEELEDIDIIFIAGGNTFYLLEKVLESGLDKVIKKLVDKGVIYFGESAGAVLAGPNIKLVDTLDDPGKAPNLKTFRGLGLVDFIALPHFENPKYGLKLENIHKKYNKKFKIIPLTDFEAIWVEGNKIRKIFGGATSES